MMNFILLLNFIFITLNLWTDCIKDSVGKTEYDEY